MSTATQVFSVSSAVQHTLAADLGRYSGSPKIDVSVQYQTTDINKVFDDSRTTGAGADVIRVDNGSITDRFGTALSYVNIKTLTVKNTHATNSITVGGGSNSVLGSDVFTVKPGKVHATNNVYVIGGSAYNLTVTPSATGTTYDVLVTGN